MECKLYVRLKSTDRGAKKEEEGRKRDHDEKRRWKSVDSGLV
jgi:hypothetical protein